jgi:hypothetical protein
MESQPCGEFNFEPTGDRWFVFRFGGYVATLTAFPTGTWGWSVVRDGLEGGEGKGGDQRQAE